MRKIKETDDFSKAYDECCVKYGPDITALDRVVLILANGHKLHKKYKDHQLHGTWKRYRECHIIEVSDDWLLVYELVGKHVLLLVDTGSHEELFGNTIS